MPPTNRSEPPPVRSSYSCIASEIPLVPRSGLDSGCQELATSLAIWPSGVLFVPSNVKWPVANNAGPEPSSNTHRSRTTLLKPVPTADQLVPFHFATLLTGTLPLAIQKKPPAYNSPLNVHRS